MGEFADEQAEEGGFSVAVFADDAGDFAALDLEVQRPEPEAFLEGLPKALASDGRFLFLAESVAGVGSRFVDFLSVDGYFSPGSRAQGEGRTGIHKKRLIHVHKA